MAELVSLSHCGHFYIMEASGCSQRHDVFTLGLFYFFLPSLSEFAAGGRGRGREGGRGGAGRGHPNPRQGALEDTWRQKYFESKMRQVPALLLDPASK